MTKLPFHKKSICIIGIGSMAIETINYLTKRDFSINHDCFETIALTSLSEKLESCKADRNVLLKEEYSQDIIDFTDSLHNFRAVIMFCDANDSEFAFSSLALDKALSATNLFRVNYIITPPTNTDTSFSNLVNSINIIDSYNCSSILLPYEDFVAIDGNEEEIIHPYYRIANLVLPIISNQFITQFDLDDMKMLFKDNKIGFASISTNADVAPINKRHAVYKSLLDRNQNDDIGCIIIGICQYNNEEIQRLNSKIKQLLDSVEGKFSDMPCIIAMSCSSRKTLVCSIYIEIFDSVTRLNMKNFNTT